MSLFGVRSDEAIACSGDMYWGVAQISPLRVRVSMSSRESGERILAMPKSRTVAWSSSVTTMFSGLMSRWMMSRWWAAAMPRAAWRTMWEARSTGSSQREMRSRSDRPSTNSMM